MRISGIEIEGQAGQYATIKRRRESDLIHVRLLTTYAPNGRDHTVQADSPDDLWSMAECLQYHLDGHEGDETAIHAYLLVIKQLAD